MLKHRLVKYSVERIRTKLDCIYLDSVKLPRGISNRQAVNDQQAISVIEMEQELESLYAEIVPVAQMSIERQFLEPALRKTSLKDKQDFERLTEAIQYVRANPTTIMER